jgi:hypothetical protein
MEKIKQDFFSWLPKAKREIKVNSNVQPQAYPSPSPATTFHSEPSSSFYPESSQPSFYPEASSQLPQKQQHVRQATFQAQTPSFLAGDGNVLFKIIQVQSDGAPLYQIVPTSSSGPTDPRPVLPSANTYNTFNTAASTQTYSHTPTVHQQPQTAPQQPQTAQQQLQQQPFHLPSPDTYTPSQSAPAPAITYQSQVSHPLPPPITPNFAAEKVTEEKSDIFNKVLTTAAAANNNNNNNNVNPRTRTARRTDAVKPAVDSSSSESTETVFYKSLPDVTKKTEEETSKPSVTESEVVVEIKDPLADADLHTFEVDLVGEGDTILTGEVKELLDHVDELEGGDSSEEYSSVYENKVNCISSLNSTQAFCLLLVLTSKKFAS